MGRYAPLRGFKVITADFGLSGTSAESPGGAGDDSVLREWCCLVRWRGSQRQFKLTQLPDGHSLQMVIGTKIGFIRRQTLPEILCHLMNLLVGRQFLQASGALTGCCFRTTVFQRILTALQIPAFSGRMYGDIFILTQNTFPNELLADFTFTQSFLLLFVKFYHVDAQHLPACRCYPDVTWQTLAGFTVPQGFL